MLGYQLNSLIEGGMSSLIEEKRFVWIFKQKIQWTSSVTLSCPKGSMIISYKLMVIVIRQAESYM